MFLENSIEDSKLRNDKYKDTQQSSVELSRFEKTKPPCYYFKENLLVQIFKFMSLM